MDEAELLRRINQMYRMAVWDHEGRQYLPVYAGYAGEITHYAHAPEAFEDNDEYKWGTEQLPVRAGLHSGIEGEPLAGNQLLKEVDQ